MRQNIYSGLDRLPRGLASDRVTPGCLVLEGGALRGTYSVGVMDALMEADVNFACTIGVSAGALNGISYVSGQIGRSARSPLRYRHDSRYFGLGAFLRNRTPFGFDFMFGELSRTASAARPRHPRKSAGRPAHAGPAGHGAILPAGTPLRGRGHQLPHRQAGIF